ncbi:MAG: nuclear transport factor 2 family protein [Smithella sp.]
MTEGEKLIIELFEKVSKQQWDDIDKFIHPAFQSVHQDGSRNKEEEIATLKGLCMGEYYLSNFRVTEDTSLMVVSYTVRAQEIINRKHTLTKPAQRLSVFVKSKDGWRWLAHANFIPIEETK